MGALAQPLLIGFSAVLCSIDIPNFIDLEPAVWGKWKIFKNEKDQKTKDKKDKTAAEQVADLDAQIEAIGKQRENEREGY